MLWTEQAVRDVRLSPRTKEDRPLELLLAVLFVFSEQGRNEVSLAEFQESIAEFQQKYPLGYSFSERFILSSDLLFDLRDLDYRGYIRDYHYRLDGLLPKRFLALTALGRGLGSKIVQKLTDDVVEDLKSIVGLAIKRYRERWRLWARETG